MMAFEHAWDTITKNDLRTIPQLSPEQQAALDSFQQNVDAAVGEPDVEDVRDESSDDACCRSLKEAIAAIPIDTWGMYLLNQALTDPEYTDGDSAYADDNCRVFANTVEIQLEIWDYDFTDREEYDRFFRDGNSLRMRRYRMDPPFADAGEYAYDSDKEQLRKDQVRQALLEYESCKARAEFDFGEEEEAHPLFTASADPFEAGWDSITKFDEDYLEMPDLEQDPHWVMGGINDQIAFDGIENLDCVEKVRRWLMAINYEGYMNARDNPLSGELWDHYSNQPAEHFEAFLRQYDWPSHKIALQMLEDCREAVRREREGEAHPDKPPLHFSEFSDINWRWPE